MLKLFDINSFQNKVSGLTDELKANYIVSLYKKYGSILVVTDTLYEANNYLQAISKYCDCLFFPMDDFLTSEAIAISPELKVTRLEALNQLVVDNNRIVITNLMGYLRYLPSKELYSKSFFELKQGDNIDINKLVNKLFDLGYVREPVVNKTGEIAVRGFVVDVFPIGFDVPVRLEFWGDEIDSIREFDVDSQRSLKNLKKVTIHSFTEFISTTTAPFEYRVQKFLKDYTDVYSILNYLNVKNVVFDDYDRLEVSYSNLVSEMMEYSISNNVQADFKYMNDFYDISYDNRIDFTSSFDTGVNYDSQSIIPFNGYDDINKRLNEYVRKKMYVVVYISSRQKIDKLMNDLENTNAIFTDEENLVLGKINFVIGSIKSGYIYDKYVVISENEIFNIKNNNYQYKTNFKVGTRIKDVGKLVVGDYVVHFLYGIGIYLGIKSILKNGLKKDYLLLEYAGGDKLYVPTSKMELITKYSSSDGANPKLNKLGTSEWSKTKARARKHIEEMTQELLELYAKREATIGFSFAENKELQDEFDNDFEYLETADQIKVSKEISADMESKHPMDRLLCGDVGYGKTEVAFRAMFKAVCSSKQVALLCPTTILSSQHYQNAIDRFKSFPVNICLLNRFVSPSVIKKNIERIKSGEIDIVIGTHRLLSDDVCFKDLGLLVIDEEHTSTYKQDNHPRYSAKDVAILRGKYNNCPVIFGSATPSLESFARAQKGVYKLLTLDKRAGNGRLPNVNVVDMKVEIKKGNFILSQMLVDKINDRLKIN